MPKRLDDLYHSFFKQQDFNELRLSVEENHKILIDRLSKEDRKTVLRIIDALGMICNYQSKASFIQGFGLGMELTTELKNYDHSIEEILNDCGQFFMPKKLMMKKKAKTIAVSVAIISLLIIPLFNQGTSEPLVPKVRPVSAPLTIRDNTPSAENKALVGEEITETSAHSTPPTETDFEPPNPSDSTKILTESNTLKENPTSTQITSKNTVTITAREPRMGDTRTVDGQKQVYFLGFGWIDDNDEPNVAIFVDGDGDINKMVGCMD